MRHQMQIVQQFFPPNVPVIEKTFLGKSCFFVKTNTKLLLKNLIIAHIKHI